MARVQLVMRKSFMTLSTLYSLFCVSRAPAAGLLCHHTRQQVGVLQAALQQVMLAVGHSHIALCTLRQGDLVTGLRMEIPGISIHGLWLMLCRTTLTSPRGPESR